MGNTDKKRIAQAAEQVMRRSNIEITEVIEADEDRDLSWTDRFAAAFAALLVCGITYTGFWLWLDLGLVRGTEATDSHLLTWIMSWRLPLYATTFTTLAAFVRPTWAYRYFGKVARAFGKALSHGPWV